MAPSGRPLRKRRKSLVLVACLLLSHLYLNGSVAHAAENPLPPKGLFNTVEFKGSLRALSKWTGIIESSRSQAHRLSTCGSDATCPPGAKSWQALQKQITGLDTRPQLIALNRFFNRWPYRLDQEVYGQSDYWATPKEFLKNSGDCEDYAITKYFALRELGYSHEQLRIVVLMDTIRGIAHAVLAVYVSDDIYILDNISDAVFSHKKYSHYWPQYSINETNRWAHARVKTKPTASPFR